VGRHHWRPTIFNDPSKGDCHGPRINVVSTPIAKPEASRSVIAVAIFSGVGLVVWVASAAAEMRAAAVSAMMYSIVPIIIWNVATNGAELFVRVGGRGPATVLLHDYGETGDMWSPLASALMADHTVIVRRPSGHGPLVPPPPAAMTTVTRDVNFATEKMCLVGQVIG
jgi:hypothetical protein